MDEKSSLGKRIQNLRIAAGLTQEQLANKIGISMAAIRNYENNLREPNGRTMVALEDFFGVTGRYLCGYTDEKIPYIDRKKSSARIVIEAEENPFYNFSDKELELLADFLLERGIKETELHKLPISKKNVLYAIALLINTTFPPLNLSVGETGATERSVG
ncbi:helix-turn-helix domain-containing protein [Anaeromassilibacillus senegalensis]|uniref:helix-turn-helix domain-containing protein n=1 Tax=Anaeromassilibacillus senegalensis TaxID=1673717 RepID=UPI000681DB71|nr:helix-turn-helix transcriptional regulator [Anaeromassilibacillus senegalensis]